MYLLLILCGVAFQTACQAETKTPLKVFIAGSLVVPFAELEKVYEAQHPEIDVQLEAHGSIQVIRHVTEIHDEIDVVLPADYALIPMLMYPAIESESGQPYASWNLQWASNRLVLAYRPESRYAGEVNAENWYQIIARPDVRFGLSDPRFDAAGYRALMIAQMAETFYADPTIFEKIFLGRFKNAITVKIKANRQVIQVPELLETTENSNILVRGGSVALLALLESGDIDYAFEYESVARQHGLAYVELPPEIHLGDPAFSADYEKVGVELDFQRFSSVQPSFQGEVITYGMTIPVNAPHPEAAASFLAFLLSPEGCAIMTAHHHPLLEPLAAQNRDAIPAILQTVLP